MDGKIGMMGCCPSPKIPIVFSRDDLRTSIVLREQRGIGPSGGDGPVLSLMSELSLLPRAMLTAPHPIRRALDISRELRMR